MRNKIIFTILIIITLILGGLLFFLNRTLKPRQPVPIFPSTSAPTGIIIPTEKISPDDFDIVSVEPKEGATDVPISSNIVITFSRSISPDEFTFYLNPETSFSQKLEKNVLTVSPQTQWNLNAGYDFSINFKNNMDKFRLYRFVTEGGGTIVYPDTRSEQFEKEQDQIMREQYPDVYVKNNTPYENQFFSATAEFDANPPAHYFLQVTPKNSNIETVQKSVEAWLQEIGLSVDAISSFDIRYVR